MRRAWIVGVVAAMCLGGGAVPPLGAEPTKYCGDRIAEAEDTVKEIEAGLARVTDSQDRSEIQGWVAQAKSHIGAAKSAAQEEECVQQVELAKTLSQDALYLVAQNK